MIFEWDDFGCDHQISDMCQSHDCRDQLLRLKKIRSEFKATLFAIPGEMTQELLQWCHENDSWIELAWHGLFHSDNWECEKMSYAEFDFAMAAFKMYGFEDFFKPVFRAPGWQISDDVFGWLFDHDWIVADQGYNDGRRSPNINAYVNHSGNFWVLPKGNTPFEVEAYHGHTWNVGALGGEPNGIYEDYVKVERLVRETETFAFITEVF